MFQQSLHIFLSSKEIQLENKDDGVLIDQGWAG